MPCTTLYFDVDQTLVDRKMNLLPGVRDTLQELHDYGYQLVAWSRSGRDHVVNVLDKTGIRHFFAWRPGTLNWAYAVLSKPDICVDDSPKKIIGQIIEIKNKNDWKNFFTKFYGKKTY
jgi:hydroxymethylpyrimidine pyrophosphatase-like HAD family hydrolase